MSEDPRAHKALLSTVSREQIARQNELTGSLYGSVFLPSIDRKSNVAQMKHLRIIEQCIVAENKREAALATCKSEKQKRRMRRQFEQQRKYERELIDMLINGGPEPERPPEDKPSKKSTQANPPETMPPTTDSKSEEDMGSTLEPGCGALLQQPEAVEEESLGENNPHNSRLETASDQLTHDRMPPSESPTTASNEHFENTPFTKVSGLTVDTSGDMGLDEDLWSPHSELEMKQESVTPACSPVSAKGSFSSPPVPIVDSTVQVQLGAEAEAFTLAYTDKSVQKPPTVFTSAKPLVPSRLFLDLNAHTLGFPSLLMQKNSMLPAALSPASSSKSPCKKTKRRRKLKGPTIPTADSTHSSSPQRNFCRRPRSGGNQKKLKHRQFLSSMESNPVPIVVESTLPAVSPVGQSQTTESTFKNSMRITESMYANDTKCKPSKGQDSVRVAQPSNDVITFDGIKSYKEAREIAMAFDLGNVHDGSTQTMEERLTLVLTNVSPAARSMTSGSRKEWVSQQLLSPERSTSAKSIDTATGHLVRPHSSPNSRAGILPPLSPTKSPTKLCPSDPQPIGSIVAPLGSSSTRVFNTSYRNADGIQTFVSSDFEKKSQLVPLDKLSCISSVLDTAVAASTDATIPLTARSDEQICQHEPLPVTVPVFVPKPSERALEEKAQRQRQAQELVVLQRKQQLEATNRMEMQMEEAVQRAFEQGLRVAHESLLRQQEMQENRHIRQEVTWLMGQIVDAIVEMESASLVSKGNEEQTLNRQPATASSYPLTPGQEILTARCLAGIVHIQAAFRGYQTRKRARRLLYQEAAECGVLGAMPGTVQGRSGWYQDPKTLNAYYFSIDTETDEWKLKVMLRCVRLILTPYQMQHQIFSRISFGEPAVL